MKKLTPGNILLLCAAILGLVSILLMFAPAVKVKDLDVSYSGANVAFGYTRVETGLGKEIKIEVFKFAFVNFLAYILAFLGIVFAVLAFFGKLGKISGFVAAGCFLVSGILYFLAVPFCAPAIEDADLVAEFKKGLTLDVGAIAAGILSVISAILCIVPAFLKKQTA